MNRRTWMIRAALSAPVLAVSPMVALAVPERDPMVDVDLQLVKLDVPSDDRRGIVMPHDVAADGLQRLEPVDVVMSWDGPKLGTVEMWYVRDGWLCCTASVPASVAKQITAGTLLAAPSLFSTHPGNPDMGNHVGACTEITRAAMVALIPHAEALWHEYRSNKPRGGRQ